MKSPGERGLTAQRLRDVRLAAGFTNQEAAAAHVRDRTRVVGLTNSQWASYESGDPRRPFQQKHREAIESVFGPLNDQPEQPAPAPAGDMAQLPARLDRQADLMTAILGRFDQQQTRINDLERQLRRMAGGLREEAAGEPLSEVPTPDGQGAQQR